MNGTDAKERIIAVKQYQDMLLRDPYRPGYHFAVPSGDGHPGDPNGAFFADGRYHLMYLYKSAETGGYHWGHISSHDLLHWRLHPDALAAVPEHTGYFSGGGFVDDDRTAYITYWKLAERDEHDSLGIAIAYSKPPYVHWEEMEPLAVPASAHGIAELAADGKTVLLGCADPSNIWKADGWYYMQTGNKEVLEKCGRAEDAPEEYRGDWTDLFRSKDLRHWEYVHRFYENTHAGEDWPDRTEDDMCPSFLPLYDAKSGGNPTGKWLQLFISHNKGCQYYVGELRGERFVPEVHGRMTWSDKTYFAPEALIDDKNRHIIWAWLPDDPKGAYEKYHWRGVYSFPRVVWWQDNMLRMAPAEELDRLQYNHQSFGGLSGGCVPVRNGASFRLKAVWDFGEERPEKAGLRVRVSDDGAEYTEIYADLAAGTLVMDASRNTDTDFNWMRNKKEEAPFVLSAGEQLSLDIFVDQSVVEVFANERQAICRRVYPADPAHSLGVYLIDGSVPRQLEAWEMDPTNLY